MEHAPGFLRLVEEARARIREVTITDVERLCAGNAPFVLLDVREHEEWTRGHLPKAHHLCKGIIERDIEGTIPDHYADIVLYCGGGYRSALAAETLQRMGYKHVESMAGGWRAWTEAKKPTEPSSR